MPVRNSEAHQSLRKAAGLQQGFDQTPEGLSKDFIATLECNPRLTSTAIVISTPATGVTGAIISTLYTIPTGYDFLLSEAHFWAVGYATASNYVGMAVTIEGVKTFIFADSYLDEPPPALFRIFPIPVLLRSGTTITLEHEEGTDGDLFGSVSGVLVENRG